MSELGLLIVARMLQLRLRFGDDEQVVQVSRESMAIGLELAAVAARHRGLGDFAQELDESAAQLRRGST